MKEEKRRNNKRSLSGHQQLPKMLVSTRPRDICIHLSELKDYSCVVAEIFSGRGPLGLR
jgi:hypothetical protein